MKKEGKKGYGKKRMDSIKPNQFQAQLDSHFLLLPLPETHSAPFKKCSLEEFYQSVYKDLGGANWA